MSSSRNESEINFFNTQAKTWWDPKGPMAPLHAMNPLRMEFILGHLPQGAPNDPPLKGLKILDVGCGAGLISLPLTRLGAQVTALDAASENISIARKYAENQGIHSITFQNKTVETFMAETPETFDAVITLEVIEHVEAQAAFLKNCLSLVKDQGFFFLSTLNQTVCSYLFGILLAENILNLLPRGTHSWRKFIPLKSLKRHLGSFQVLEEKGMIYNPFSGDWQLSSNTSVNYILCAQKSTQMHNSGNQSM